MLTYEKRWWGFLLLFKLEGSALPRALPLVLISTTLGVYLSENCRDYIVATIENTNAFQSFTFVVGFTLVFRIGNSISRYWEARSHLQTLNAKLADLGAKLFGYTWRKVGKAEALGNQEEAERERVYALELSSRIAHLLSLAHAVAMQELRKDKHVENIVPEAMYGAKNVNIRELMRLKKEIPNVRGEELMLASTEEISEEEELATAETLKHLRGKTGQQGLWFVRVENALMLSTKEAGSYKYHRAMPLSCLGGVSAKEAEQLRCTKEKFVLVCTWIYQLLTEYRVVVDEDGNKKAVQHFEGTVAPKMCSGMVGEANLAYLLNRKISETPFPFPHAQLVSILLLCYLFALPMVVTSVVTHTWLTAAICCVSSLSFVSLSEVARELEDPFIFPPNDLPIIKMQHQLNERLLTSLSAYCCPEEMGLRGVVAAPNEEGVRAQVESMLAALRTAGPVRARTAQELD